VFGDAAKVGRRGRVTVRSPVLEDLRYRVSRAFPEHSLQLHVHDGANEFRGYAVW
jgi:hypothetical protein